MNTGKADRMECVMNETGLGSFLMSGFDISFLQLWVILPENKLFFIIKN
jgi:hypothetical protein